jgi:hypothetical protein
MSPNNRHLIAKRLFAVALIALSLAVWQYKPDIIELIVRQKPVLLGAYSQGHFGALLLFTIMAWSLAAIFWSRLPLWRALAGWLATSVLLIAIILTVTYVAYWFNSPRYVETSVSTEKLRELKLKGIVRHRPPNQRYQFIWTDKPEHRRSYPGDLSGYGAVNIVLTSDNFGYRNPNPRPPFNTVVVGDSFAAGSHVSDDQGWSELLNSETALSIYNLGVSGSGPSTYLNNFAHYGLDKGAQLVIIMIYEGNDFKAEVASKGLKIRGEPDFDFVSHLEQAFNGSPVTAGLRRFSEQVLEKIGADQPVPGYSERVGWMPVKLFGSGARAQYYGFKPNRLLYLATSKEGFLASSVWQITADVLQQTIDLAQANGLTPVLVYAPSKPHIVMPLVEDQLDPEQLRNFVAYKNDKVAPPLQFKQELFANLDSQEKVFMDHCRTQSWRCLSLTAALRAATKAGQQTYYSYDQHWTPEGNRVVADTIAAFLDQEGLLSLR